MNSLEFTILIVCFAYGSAELSPGYETSASGYSSGQGALNSAQGGAYASQGGAYASQGYGYAAPVSGGEDYSQQSLGSHGASVYSGEAGSYSTDYDGGYGQQQAAYAQNAYQDITSNHIGDAQSGYSSSAYAAPVASGGYSRYTTSNDNSGESAGGFQPSYGSALEGHDVSSIDLTQQSLHGYAGAGHVEHNQVIHTHAEAIPISKHVEITKHVPYPVYKQIHVPVQRPVKVQLPHPILVPVPHPYPIHIPVSKPVAVPVVKEITIPYEKIVPYPVIKQVPFTVEKHVPYPVERIVHVHRRVPVPIRVPVVKTVIHRVKPSHGWGDWD